MSGDGARCGSCGQVISVEPGQTVPPHQPQGERGTVWPGSTALPR